MPKRTLDIEQLVQRAQALQDAKIAAVRRLAQARQAVDGTAAAEAKRRADLERELAQARRASQTELDAAWKAALASGWSTIELKKAGFAAPARQRPRPAAAPARVAGAPATGTADAVAGDGVWPPAMRSEAGSGQDDADL